MAMSFFMEMPGARAVPGGGVMGRVLAVGDVVEWDSTAGGAWSRREGRVVEVVPAGCRPRHIRSGVTRDHESYVVACASETLWPVAAGLRHRAS